MGLKDTINQDMKAAMKAKDQAALRTLRSIKAAILVVETSEGRAAGELKADEEMKLLTKQAKQRKDSLEQYEKNGREDLAAIEREELIVIEKYLPKQLSEEDVKTKVEEIISETGASSMKDMGRVMGLASKAMAGQADGKLISKFVKEILS
ncbi:MAG: GatB/YqeY domain-containing protein [Bacteroidota bacterium]